MAKNEKKQQKASAPETVSNSALIVKDYDLKGFVRKSKPPFVKPMELPVGSVVIGEILAVTTRKVQEGKKTEKETMQLHLKLPNGRECLFPVNAVIGTAMDENPKNYIGWTIAIKTIERRMSGEFKKEYYNCEVFLKEP